MARSQDAETARLGRKQQPKKKKEPIGPPSPSGYKQSPVSPRRQPIGPPAPDRYKQSAVSPARRGGGNPFTLPPDESFPTPTGKLVTISLFGRQVTVVDSIVPRLKRVEAKWLALGGNSFYEVRDVGGYADRDVRGRPGKKSQHAHGWAVDVNATENPMGKQLVTDMPAEFVRLWLEEGFGWGGFWNSSKDAMHFSMSPNEGGQGRHAAQFLGQEFENIELVSYVPDKGGHTHDDESAVTLTGVGVDFVRRGLTAPNYGGVAPGALNEMQLGGDTVSFDSVTPEVVTEVYLGLFGRKPNDSEIRRWLGRDPSQFSQGVTEEEGTKTYRAAQLGLGVADTFAQEADRSRRARGGF